MAITSRPWKRGHVFVLIEETQWVSETSAAKCSVAHNSEVTQQSRRSISINAKNRRTSNHGVLLSACGRRNLHVETKRNLKHSNKTDTAHQASCPPPPDQTTRHSAIAVSKHRHQTRLPTCYITGAVAFATNASDASTQPRFVIFDAVASFNPPFLILANPPRPLSRMQPQTIADRTPSNLHLSPPRLPFIAKPTGDFSSRCNSKHTPPKRKTLVFPTLERALRRAAKHRASSARGSKNG